MNEKNSGSIHERRHFNIKRPVFIFLGIFIAAVAVILLVKIFSSSVPHVLFWGLGNENGDIRPERIIGQIQSGDNVLVFYYSQSGGAACAVMEETAFGYRLLHARSEGASNEEVPATVDFSRYNGGQNCLVWGRLRDDIIDRAMIYYKNAEIIELDGIRYYYIIFGERLTDYDGFEFSYTSDGMMVTLWSRYTSPDLIVYVWKSGEKVNYAIVNNLSQSPSPKEIKRSGLTFRDTDSLRDKLQNVEKTWQTIKVVQSAGMALSSSEMEDIAVEIDIYPYHGDSHRIGIYHDDGYIETLPRTMEGVTLTAKEAVYPTDVNIVYATWKNTTDTAFIFGLPFKIEKKTDGRWHNPFEGKYVVFFMPGFALEPHTTAKASYPITVYTDYLEPGEYRIATDFNSRDPGDFSTYDIYAEFAVE